ncbi:MAG: adenosylcobinamide-GDP ribazoletransferase [Bacteroidaceae bacterium]|nr:adenosylcobinamide-GDP ribazoletransferase [Bacteroidaceae bacterium]
MHRLQNIFKRVIATLVFFTRLPLWRITNVEREYYERVVPLWPLAGWVTGGIMAVMVWMGVYLMGKPSNALGLVVALAMASRVLLTGALHEDGFADFCDGFGGGTSRERTLAIMKDSHIGTYGVLGLVLYALVMWNCLSMLLAGGMSPLYIIGIDALSKWMSSSIICFLPYARIETEAKNQLLYQRPTITEIGIGLVLGLMPITTALLLSDSILWQDIALSVIPPIVGCAVLFHLMHRRIGGYTGDCCGATFIITEILFYISICAVHFS